MTQQLKLGVNTSIFDGHDLELTFATIKQLGYDYVELAYNQGYVGDLDDSLFGKQNAQRLVALLEKNKLATLALGCTFNMGRPDASEWLETRIRFADMLDVRLLNVCTARRDDYGVLVKNLRRVVPTLERYQCTLLIENGGDLNYDAFSTAEDGERLLRDIGSDRVAINGDAGNTVSLRPEVDAIGQTLDLLPHLRHCHIKDVKKEGTTYCFPSIGAGMLDYRRLLPELLARDIPCTLEIPLRMHRLEDSMPVRSPHPAPIEEIVTVLRESKAYIDKQLRTLKLDDVNN